MGLSPLVSTDWLAEHLDDADVKLAETYFEGGDDYIAGHIPGAMSWNWKDMFWDPAAREFATPTQMAKRLSENGISESDTIVLYSEGAQFSVYGFWVLSVMCGHPDVRVLDGGRKKWILEGRSLSREVPHPVACAYQPQRAARDDASRIRRDAVLASLNEPGVGLVDVRSSEEYLGLRVMPGEGFDHGAPVAGHIPGALHVPFTDLLNPDNSFRSSAEIEEAFRQVHAAPDQVSSVILYCRLGHRASLAWFAMNKIVGWEHAHVYDGSWTEWGNFGRDAGGALATPGAAVPAPVGSRKGASKLVRWSTILIQ